MTRTLGILWVTMCLVSSAFSFAVAESKESDTVRFFVKARADYTDNRDSVENDEESNIDLYLTPRVELAFDWTRTVLDLYYEPSFRYRTDPSPIQNDSELYHYVGLSLLQDVNRRVSLSVDELFNLTDDPKVEFEGGTREDQSYIYNRVQGRIDFAFNRRSAISLTAQHHMKRYDEDAVADMADEDMFKVGILGRWQVARDLDALAMLDYSDYGYESMVRGVEVDRDFTSIFGGVGVEKIFSKQLRGGIKAGVQNVDYSDNGLDKETSPYAEVWAKTSSSPATRYSASVGHGIRDADAFPYSAQQYTDLRGRMEHDVSAKVSAGASATYRMASYDDSAPTSAPANFYRGERGGDEDTLVIGLDGTYRLSDESYLQLTYSHQNIDSDVDRSYDRNTVSLVAAKQF